MRAKLRYIGLFVLVATCLTVASFGLWRSLIQKQSVSGRELLNLGVHAVIDSATVAIVIVLVGIPGLRRRSRLRKGAQPPTREEPKAL